MARDFEDHCWKDIVPAEILKLYEPYRRDVFVGPRPALLAIDLYNLVFRGDPEKAPHELVDEFPNSCGRFAWEAVEPIQQLFAASRKSGLPVFHVTGSVRKGRVHSTRRQPGSEASGELLDIHSAFAPEPGEVVIRKEGDSLIIAPARRNWPSYADEAPAVDEDFMTDRPALMDSGRVVF